MRRDIFRRGVRMTHYFGETEERADPLGASTFDFEGEQRKVRPSQLSEHGKACEVQEYGEHVIFAQPRSPVQKPDGNLASTGGPAPDWAEGFARPLPWSTKKRKDHLKTDK